MSKFRTFKNLMRFVIDGKKYWLIPLILILGVLGLLLIITEGSALAPFIYTIF